MRIGGACVRFAQTSNGDKEPPAAINSKIMRENETAKGPFTSNVQKLGCIIACLP